MSASLRWLTLLLSIAQALAPQLGFLGIGVPIGGAYTSPVVPAGYAFAIWGPIFLLTIAYALWAVLPANREHPLPGRLGVWPALAFALCVAWSLAAQFAPLAVGAQVAIFVALLGCLIVVVARLADQAVGPTSCRGEWAARAGFGLYAGWSSLAVFANISGGIALHRFDWTGMSFAGQSVSLLLGAGCIAIAVLFRARGPLAYTAAVVWGLAGVAIANRALYPQVAIVAGALIGALLLALAAARRRPFTNASHLAPPAP